MAATPPTTTPIMIGVTLLELSVSAKAADMASGPVSSEDSASRERIILRVVVQLALKQWQCTIYHTCKRYRDKTLMRFIESFTNASPGAENDPQVHNHQRREEII